MKIRTTNETTYTIVASPLLNKMEAFFKAHGYSYELLFKDDIPADVERVVDMDGHKQTKYLCCIKSNMNTDDVHELMLRAWRPSKYGEVDEP